MQPAVYVYYTYMDVVWDPRKSASNLAKHGITFADASTVLEDPLALSIEDDRHDEQRFVTLGHDLTGRLLVVVFAFDGPNIRLISARRATPNERRDYEEGV